MHRNGNLSVFCFLLVKAIQRSTLRMLFLFSTMAVVLLYPGLDYDESLNCKVLYKTMHFTVQLCFRITFSRLVLRKI